MKKILTLLALFCVFHLEATEIIKCGTGWWSPFRQNFGMEKVSLSFPNQPAISKNGTQSTAISWKGQVCYTFTGYFPPVGNIDTPRFFDDILLWMQTYPFSLSEHRIYENSCGNWVLEYVAQDHFRHVIIRSFSVVTPFNAYTLQCIQPFGTREQYSYFRDSFRILCECEY